MLIHIPYLALCHQGLYPHLLQPPLSELIDIPVNVLGFVTSVLAYTELDRQRSPPGELE